MIERTINDLLPRQRSQVEYPYMEHKNEC
jgi:hypothetical protein